MGGMGGGQTGRSVAENGMCREGPRHVRACEGDDLEGFPLISPLIRMDLGKHPICAVAFDERCEKQPQPPP